MSKSRREFIRKMGAGIIGTGFTGNLLLAQQAEHIPLAQLLQQDYGPNDTIRLGAIGMGIMGFNNCRIALQLPGVELVACCDLYDGRLIRSKEVFGDHLFTTRNYQDILDREDIDAVIISTSDHWHDHISIAAMKAGKHVYCEKPMVHHLEEGHAVIKAQKETGKVFQVGSQRVSSIIYQKARELMASQIIGDLVLVEVWYDRHSALGAWQYSIPPDASEKTVDWQAFQGDAPKMPFDKTRFFRWRNYRDYGTGVAGDLFVHLFSGVHTILDSHGPNRIYSSGGLRYWKDGRDVPDIILGIYDYPEAKTHPAFNLQLRCNFVDGGGGGSKFRFVGSEGVLELNGRQISVRRNKLPEAPGYGGWDSYNTFPEATQNEFKQRYEAQYPERPQMSEPEELIYEAPQGYSSNLDHWANFIAGIRNGQHIVEDASFGLRAAGPSLASNQSYFEQRVIHWDPEKMEVKK